MGVLSIDYFQMLLDDTKKAVVYYCSTPTGRQELATKASMAYKAAAKFISPESPSLNRAKEVVALTSAQFDILLGQRQDALRAAIPTMKARLGAINGTYYQDPTGLLDIAYKTGESTSNFNQYNDLKAERDRLANEIPQAEELLANPDKLGLKIREEQLQALAGDRVQESAQISWRPYAIFAMGVVTTLCYKYLRSGAQCAQPAPCDPCPVALPTCCLPGSFGSYSANASTTC